MKFGKIVIAGIILLAMIGIAGAIEGPEVAPTLYDDNPPCEGLVGFIKDDYLIKIDSVDISVAASFDEAEWSEPYWTPLGNIYLMAYETDLGPVFDWEADFAPEGIFVKGGNNGNLYDYRTTLAEEMEDDGLHSPMGPNDKYSGLSHILLCGGYSAPEFPSIAIPAGMLVGFLGLVTVVRGRKE